jgi:hypothetical protein
VTGGAGLPEPPVGADADAADAGLGTPAGGWAPHDVPSAPALLDAVREFLEAEVLPVTEGRVRFHVRVATNVVAMVARELVLGPGHAAAHAARLDRFGVHSDAELAASIRSGALDGRADEVRAAVRATVADKLAVANPGYLRGAADDDAVKPTA